MFTNSMETLPALKETGKRPTRNMECQQKENTQSFKKATYVYLC